LGFSGYFRSLTDVSGYSGSLADVGGYSRSLADVGGYLILVESSGILRRGADISGNLRLWFGFGVVSYRAFLLIIRGGK